MREGEFLTRIDLTLDAATPPDEVEPRTRLVQYLNGDAGHSR